MEILKTPSAFRRYQLLRIPRRLLNRLVGAPMSGVNLGVRADADVDEPWGGDEDELIKGLVRQGSLDHETQAQAVGAARRERKSQRVTARDARDEFLKVFDVTKPVPSVEEALVQIVSDRALLREVRGSIAQAVASAGFEHQRARRILGSMAVRCWAFAWVHMARAACLASSRNAQRSLPGYTDLGLLGFMPFCDVFVVDDEGMRCAAVAAQSVMLSGRPVVMCFAQFRAQLFS